MEWLTYVGVFLLGLFLIFLELFIPSGGVLGIAAIICLVYSVHALFSNGYPWTAWAAIAITIVYIVVIVRFWLKRMRHSATLGTSEATGRDVERARVLIGRGGVTVTALRPAGIARIAGERFDVVALDTFLEADTPISVVEVSGNRIVVRRRPADASDGKG